MEHQHARQQSSVSNTDTAKTDETEAANYYSPQVSTSTSDDDRSSVHSVKYNNNNFAVIPTTAATEFDNDDDDSENNNDDTKCNFFGWKPNFLQRFANIKTFVACLVVKGTLLGMLHSYHGGIISTIEKRFRLPSSVIGTIGSVGELGELLTIFFVAHYGGSGHRPRWLAVGTFILALAAALAALPELLAPNNDFLNSANNGNRHANKLSTNGYELCSLENDEFDFKALNTSTTCHINNSTVQSKPTYIPAESWAAVIIFAAASLLQNVGSSFGLTLTLPYIHDNVPVRSTPVYFSIMMLGRIGGPLLGNAMSSAFTAVWINPLKGPPPGITGRDDPRWIGAWYLGFVVSAILLSIISLILSMFPRRMPVVATSALSKVDTPMKKLNKKKQEQKDMAVMENTLPVDPHTDGLGEPTAIVASDLAPPPKTPPVNRQQKQKTLREMPKDLCYVLLNVTVMARALAGAFDAFIIAGFAKFLMKYAEVTFRYPAYIANIAIGFSGIIPVALGSMAGAVIIRKFDLQPRQIAFIMFMTHIVVAIGSVGLALFSCGSVKLAGLDMPDLAAASTPSPKFTTLNEYLDLMPYSNCSKNTCHCSQLDFNPVCDLNSRLTYFSPCHAGCSQAIDATEQERFANATGHRRLGRNSKIQLYGNCSCGASSFRNGSSGHSHSHHHALLSAGGLPTKGLRAMRSGKCEGPCHALFGYIALKIVLAVILSLPFSGSIMILYRIVAPDKKSMAQGVQSFLSSALAFAPAPIIVGALFDMSCRLWNTRTDPCTGASSLGNCLLYDTDRLRWRYHLLPAGIRVLSTICDFVVFLKVRHLTFEKKVDVDSKI